MPVDLEIAVIAADLVATGDRFSAKCSGFPGSKTLEDFIPVRESTALIFVQSLRK